ncbi:hypothetical protein QBC38DRAFT_517170 [Podospora fimiseda]|uniref:Ig-like domain-containing protein n=1 Tax=Podospora fimiseda TaxID=252190 RepID=A0AAN7BHB3_9PEZI|nr:hypothetical protein QBC38DRAFT_517170 [Podospora fimiseda]
MLSRIILLQLASTAVFISAQTPQTPGGCTTNSFTIPSWFIQELEYTPETRHVSFQILNRPANISTTASCQASDKGWNNCETKDDDFFAQVLIEGTIAQISVNHTWECTDRNLSTPLKFVAAGKNTLNLDNSNQIYTPEISPLLIRGSLYEPVQVTPVYAPGPIAHNKLGCLDSSARPSWTLSHIWYSDTIGDGLESVSSRVFNLFLVNDITGYEASCMHGSLSNDIGPTTLVCYGAEFQEPYPNRYTISTTASFDPETFLFSFSQTWYCDDQNPAKPVQITASASSTIPLQCNTKESTDYNEQPTVVKACQPEAEVLGMEGSITQTAALPPYAIEDPVPRADGCTISSILNPVWTFSHFSLASNAETTTVTFEVILATARRGFQYPIPVSVTIPHAGDAVYYPCEIGPDGENEAPLWPYECSVKYAADTKEIVLSAAWACHDLDDKNSINFKGISTTQVNSPLSCEKDAEGLDVCYTEDTAFTWRADIKNVTWSSAPKQA